MYCRTGTAVLAVMLSAPLAWGAEPASKEVAADMTAVVQGGNDFAIDLYARLRTDKPGNLCFSPYSIRTALAMTSAGAAGETETQMADVLHFSVPQARLHPALGALQRRLASSDDATGFQLRVANRLWGQEGFHFLPEFLQVNKADYGAELGLVDFKQAAAARKLINSWVAEQTERKIPELLPPDVPSPESRLVLTNAIYFKATWTQQFRQQFTADAPFYATRSEPIKTPLMRLVYQLKHYAGPGLQVLELPYGSSRHLSMVILLPTQRDGLADLEKQLTSKNFQAWSAGLRRQLVDVYLPKFKISSEFGLQQELKALGMPLAFSPRDADFSRLTTQEPLFISAVIHKALVDVDEEGTEAAAATAVVMKYGSAATREEPVPFRADHPFVFLIRDNRTQTILFLGRVVNPKS